MSNHTRKRRTQGAWMAFTKVRNSGSGRMELFGSRSNTDTLNASNVVAVLPMSLGDADNGVFRLSSGSLYFLKLYNCGSSSIEVHRIGPNGNWSGFDIHSGSAFRTPQDRNFDIDAEDLWSIDCSGNPNDNAHLEVATKSSSYKTVHGWGTPFKKSSKDKGTFFVRNGSVYFVQYHDTNNGMIQVHRTRRSEYYESNGAKGFNTFFSHDYNNYDTWNTWLGVGEAANGYFCMMIEGDLHYMKVRNCDSARIEVHSALASEGYGRQHSAASSFNQGDGGNGVFISANDVERLV